MIETPPDTTPTEFEGVYAALAEGKRKRLRRLLRDIAADRIASLLEALPAEDRLSVWQQIPEAREAEVLGYLDPRQALELQRDADTEVLEELLRQDRIEPMQIGRLREALEAGKFKRVIRVFRDIHPAEAAGLLEALPPPERSTVWELLDSERAGRILVQLHDEVRAKLALEMGEDELIAAVRKLDLDDLVDLIQALPPGRGRRLLLSMDERKRKQLASMLSYPEESAGGLMNIDHIAVRADVKISSIQRYLRLLEDLPDHTDKLMVVDRNNHYLGVLRLSRLVTSAPDAQVQEVMDEDFEALNVQMSSQEVARKFEDLDMLSVAVVDEHGALLGRITVDDVMDIIREHSERALMNMAGLNDEADMFAPVLTSMRRRSVWLAVNLVAAFLAASVIGRFQGTIEQIVALAVLMPIVASMGGIAGSQTLTLVIRGLALGQIEVGNVKVLLGKEIGIGLLNGIIWAVVVAGLAYFWFGSIQIGAIIGAAIMLNLLCAAVAGLSIPLILRRFGIDPALAGGVMLMTVTDVVGFFAFLGLATLLLL